jgi:hypothetical protein
LQVPGAVQVKTVTGNCPGGDIRIALAASTPLPVQSAVKIAGATGVSVVGTIRRAAATPRGRPVNGNSMLAGPVAAPAGIYRFIWLGETKINGTGQVLPAASMRVTPGISPRLVGQGGPVADAVWVVRFGP